MMRGGKRYQQLHCFHLTIARWDGSPILIVRARISEQSASHLARLRMKLGERLSEAAGVEVDSHGPGLTGVVVRISPSQEIEGRTGIGAGNQAPLLTVPVLDQRLREAVRET